MIIYLVTQSSGQYDDYSCSNLMGFKAEWRAREFIEQCKAQDARINEQGPKVRQFFRKWELTNKMYADHVKIDWPNPLPKNATKEEQRARDKLIRGYHKIQNANSAKTQAWSVRAEEACREFMKTIGVSDEDAHLYVLPMWSFSTRAFDYDIEEIVVEDDPNEI